MQLLKKPIVIHTHGYDVFTVPSINYGLRRKKIGRICVDYAWKRANTIITTCNKAKSEIEKTGIKAEKINVLYNGIDENRFNKSKNVIPKELLTLRESNDIIFLSVAMAAPVKNHNRMLKAFENLVEKYRSKHKIKLVLIGTKPITPDKFQNSDVIYLGKKNHSEINQYYNIADAFVLPSISEAHPLSLLEAMSCELPVIASNVGGIPETLGDNRFLVDPINTVDILKKFELIIQMDQAEREKIGLENRQKVLNHFTLDKHVDNLKTIYTPLL